MESPPDFSVGRVDVSLLVIAFVLYIRCVVVDRVEIAVGLFHFNPDGSEPSRAYDSDKRQQDKNEGAVIVVHGFPRVRLIGLLGCEWGSNLEEGLDEGVCGNLPWRDGVVGGP